MRREVFHLWFEKHTDPSHSSMRMLAAEAAAKNTAKMSSIFPFGFVLIFEFRSQTPTSLPDFN